MKNTVSNKKIFIYVLIRSWMNFDNFDRCINSVLDQEYKNYKILFIDDNSGYSSEQKKRICDRLSGHVCVFNATRKYSLFNAWSMIWKYADNDDAIVFNLDGDDWLFNKHSLSLIAETYNKNKNCWLTYGECLIWDGYLSTRASRFVLPDINKPYSKAVVNLSLYRKKPFLPLHPRTWKVWLFKKINKIDFQDTEGDWVKFAEDQAIYYPMLEMANGNFKVIKTPLYVYNIETKNNDYKRNLLGQLKDELTIRKKEKYASIK